MSLKNDASSSHDGGSNRESVIDDHGRRKSTCGYCKSPARSSISHGLSAQTLTVYDYQGLLLLLDSMCDEPILLTE
jgi:arginine-tRNA-protein transferase